MLICRVTRGEAVALLFALLRCRSQGTFYDRVAQDKEILKANRDAFHATGAGVLLFFFSLRLFFVLFFWGGSHEQKAPAGGDLEDHLRTACQVPCQWFVGWFGDSNPWAAWA